MSAPFLFDTCVVQQYLDARAQQGSPEFWSRVDDALATSFEVRRGLAVLARKGEGRRKIRMAELFLRNAMILELGGRGGEPWRVGVRLYADGRSTSRPSRSPMETCSSRPLPSPMSGSW